MQPEHHNITGIVPTLTQVARWALAHGFGVIVRPAKIEHTANAVLTTGSRQLEPVLVTGLTSMGWAFSCLPIKITGDLATFTILVRLPEEP